VVVYVFFLKKLIKIKKIKNSTNWHGSCMDTVLKSSENENLNLLLNKFGKFLKKFGKYLKRRGNKCNQRRYNFKCNDSNNTSNFTCYNCGKQGIIKLECPNISQTKEKGVYKKKGKQAQGKTCLHCLRR